MSADKNDNKKTAASSGPESQSQRWAKYGSNVALMIVLVIVIASLVTYIVQAKDVRIDTTAQGANSLKPQTLNILRDLKTDIKIVSLYTHIKPSVAEQSQAGRAVDKPGIVSDLLDGYRRASSHISIDAFDPISDRTKQDQLLTELTERYGKAIKGYQDFLTDYGTASKQLLPLVTSEAAKASSLPADSLGDDKNSQMLQSVFRSVQSTPKALESEQTSINRQLKEHRPDYKGIVASLRKTLDGISKNSEAIVGVLDQFKTAPTLPPAIHQYVIDSPPQQQAIKKMVDEQIAKIDKLGEIKIDELTSALNIPNPILIMGPNDWRILSENQVWPENANVKMYTDGKVAPSFAGEQQITSAIVALTSSNKQKIVFLRPGGAPMTAAGFPPFIPEGRLSAWADRLREYNFEVLEKDLSGQWAMQAMQRQMPSAPEPEWAAINDAVWVVLDFGGQMAGGPEPIAPKLAEHLGHGGSAIVLVGPQSDNLAEVMKPWGVDIRSEALAVHKQPPPAPKTGGQIDPFQEALRRAWFWGLKSYGDADLAKPLKNLDSIFAPVVVVGHHAVDGYTAQTLLPLPTVPEAQESWGETDLNSLEGGTTPTFDPKTDVPAPIAAGVAVEKKGGGRLVVIGAATFAYNDYLNIADPEAASEENPRFVARFPGNGELATNASFWAAKMDTMIALSPAALQVSRISDMSTGMLRFWRIGVVLILPALVVLAGGLGMYLARRD
ncbi:MAG TPA: hypothetical protein VIM11_02395 [Tepidisphaeraceae bacterium]|jgi:hypothetical protein